MLNGIPPFDSFEDPRGIDTFGKVRRPGAEVLMMMPAALAIAYVTALPFEP